LQPVSTCLGITCC